jgi:hypothetical protein
MDSIEVLPGDPDLRVERHDARRERLKEIYHL